MHSNKIIMAISEQDLRKFYEIQKEAKHKPDVCIGICVGNTFTNERFGSQHHPFVVENLGQIIGEFDTLNEALSTPGAIAYGSTPTCQSCAKLKIGSS
jgi:hypothetical protein